MPSVKQDLIAIKRLLLTARTALQDAVAIARRMGDAPTAAALRTILELIKDEIDSVNGALRRLS